MDKNTEIRLPYFVPIEPLFRFFSGLLFFGSLALVASNLYPWPGSFSDDLLQALGAELFILAFFAFLFFKPSGLSLTQEDFCHMKNYFWKQEVAWHLIRKVQMAVGENRTYYMDVFHEDKRAPNPLPIFLKPYTEKGVSVFVAMLETKAAHAELDERTRAMKKGFFPSVFFGDT
jgi:hypothetical protein